MKKKMLEIIILALWAFSFSYLVIILRIQKNGLYIVVGFPILFVGGLLIVHLFQNKNENGK
ncbi:hypothetical protein EXW39_28065 (plasmid) [Bacillus mycoides]|uniref:hypothetical protein n=1 Tax=Bacillus mycoides TaxID=1405 RepID=UPI001C023D7F|nr:hypothetical protein [Bacillus mycoides]QWH59571.1 hypothetical protein EXW39_05125 [Bacillus mycoides]QWH63960.1 hypothetical protein EXW39_28065 [Bacillus mycoides]